MTFESAAAAIEPPPLLPLPRSFYEPSAKTVARHLLGHFLIRRTADGFAGGVIVETEAYVKGDPACHAYCGRTERNKVMWENPGHAYVYFIYGCYYCFNTVCRPPGQAEAVLIRAIEPDWGLEFMRRNRTASDDKHLTSGPGKLCAALKIDRSLDGADLCDTASPIFIAKNPRLNQTRRRLGPLITTTRVGLTQAADWPLRYLLEAGRSISKRPARKRAASSSAGAPLG
jgi:DNA-3-methyladenine glycosylase